MLVLSRRSGESIVIGDDIAITVVHLSRGRVQLGIAAPRWIAVHRGEVHDRASVDRAAAAAQREIAAV